MADENPSVPPKVNPLGARTPTLKLKPMIRPNAGGFKSGLKLPPKPGAASAAPAPEAAAAPVPEPTPAPASAESKSQTSSLEQLKSVTQTLKSATAQIPQQAILHKTGIIADPGLTEAQMAAAKARTSRISLSAAMGVAPVKNESAPMKTIRIKRPVDLPTATAPAAPAPDAPAPEVPAPEAAAAEPSTTVTQRKTIKITRPGGAVRPAGKFGIKKPAPSQAETVAKDSPAAAAGADDAVADIPDLPVADLSAPVNNSLAAAAGVSTGAAVEKDVPKAVAMMGLVIQIAACLVMGLLAYKLYIDTTVSTF